MRVTKVIPAHYTQKVLVVPKKQEIPAVLQNKGIDHTV